MKEFRLLASIDLHCLRAYQSVRSLLQGKGIEHSEEPDNADVRGDSWGHHLTGRTGINMS